MTKLIMEDEGQQIAVSVPLFLRKLWKMVNDKEAENVIGWNSTGDGFVIYDQLQFITKLLPKYFKHNNMASFIRQLNFYDFHKVSGIDKDEIQFTHSCFLKDLPETLVFIRRKCTSLRSKLTNNVKDEELTEILSVVKELKSKHALVDNELKMLKQENAALWNEVNNLRLKHAKQTKIINKIIHFLISYMHSHQNPLSKGKVSVGRRNAQNLKTGPTILEIDYHNGPNYVQKKAKQNSYNFTEPGQSGAITYPSAEVESCSNIQPTERTLDEILDKVGATINENKMTKQLVKASSTDNSNINMATNEKPSSSNESNLEAKNSQDVKTKAFENSNASFGIYTPAYRKKQVPLQKPVKYKILHNPRENLGLYLNNTQVELSSLQEMLNNLNSMELTNFCNLIEEAEMENSKEARPDLVNICQEIDDEQRLSDNDNLVDSDEYVKSSFAEELADLPMEPTTTNETNLDSGEYSATLQIPSDLQSGQYSDGNLNDIESDVLPDEYFTI